MAATANVRFNSKHFDGAMLIFRAVVLFCDVPYVRLKTRSLGPSDSRYHFCFSFIAISILPERVSGDSWKTSRITFVFFVVVFFLNPDGFELCRLGYQPLTRESEPALLPGIELRTKGFRFAAKAGLPEVRVDPPRSTVVSIQFL